MSKTVTLQKTITAFHNYGLRVVGKVRRLEPKATYSMRFLALCYGSGLSVSQAAQHIVQSHQDVQRKRRTKKT